MDGLTVGPTWTDRDQIRPLISLEVSRTRLVCRILMVNHLNGFRSLQRDAPFATDTMIAAWF